mmetsp:Transcript_8671/g.27652  ORF Transcript_8671/g.27652 Transcript_8671/m.27652 type:complete len:270 (+) Transcript_8671:686-1495(+)
MCWCTCTLPALSTRTTLRRRLCPTTAAALPTRVSTLSLRSWCTRTMCPLSPVSLRSSPLTMARVTTPPTPVPVRSTVDRTRPTFTGSATSPRRSALPSPTTALMTMMVRRLTTTTRPRSLPSPPLTTLTRRSTLSSTTTDATTRCTTPRSVATRTPSPRSSPPPRSTPPPLRVSPTRPRGSRLRPLRTSSRLLSMASSSSRTTTTSTSTTTRRSPLLRPLLRPLLLRPRPRAPSGGPRSWPPRSKQAKPAHLFAAHWHPQVPRKIHTWP